MPALCKLYSYFFHRLNEMFFFSKKNKSSIYTMWTTHWFCVMHTIHPYISFHIYFVLTIKTDPRIDQKSFLSSLCLEVRMDVKLICFYTLFFRWNKINHQKLCRWPIKNFEIGISLYMSATSIMSLLYRNKRKVL